MPHRAPLHAALSATLLVGTALFGSLAQAATATPEQEHAVVRELNDWFKGLAGGGFMAGDYAIQPQPNGGAYTLTAPLAPDLALTGHLIPQDDGRWRLFDVKLPSPATFTVSRPAPAQDGQPAATSSRTVEFSTARQQTSGTLDPTYAMPSSVQQRFEAYQLGMKTNDVLLLLQLARAANETTLTPVSDKRLDVAYDSALDGLLLDQRRQDGRAFHLVADHGHATSLISSVSRERGPAFFHALATLIADRAGKRPLDAATSRAPLTADQRDHARALLDTLEGLAAAAQVDLEMNAVQVQAGKPQSGSVNAVMRHVRASAGASTADGVLTTFLDIGVEDMSFPGLRATVYADLIPTHIHVRPTLAGIGTRDLLTYAHQLLDAADQGQSARPSPAPLFAHGNVVAGLDAIAFNVGPTSFDGHGTVTFTAPDAVTGEGQVTATDLDALIDRAKQDPTMQTALAVLTIAKGIGHASGNQTVWDLSYQDRKVLVNGLDVMAMASAAGGSHARPSARPPAPVVPSPAPTPPAPSPSVKPPPM